MTGAAAVPLNCPDPTLRTGAQGMEFVAVDDANARLIVTFFNKIANPPETWLFGPASYALTGGHRLFPRILSAVAYDPIGEPAELAGRRVLLQLDGPGDFSIYTLTITGPDIDPFFAARQLRFRLACDAAFDCRALPPSQAAPPELSVTIDYLTKDYAGFRQALLDFIGTRIPWWTERSEADIGMMLLELLAHTGDSLSYVQDRIANEAFLDTASQRRSVAGHLQLVGYQIDNGASAHTWLAFDVNADATISAGSPVQVTNSPQSSNDQIVVFETLGDAALFATHNRMPIYTWENSRCCISATAGTLALDGPFGDLKAGDYLVIDSGQGQRDVIQLASTPQILAADPIKANPNGPITVITWTSTLSADYCAADSFVRGNVVPATQGESIHQEALRVLTDAKKAALLAEIQMRRPWQRIPRQRLTLAQAPLAYLDPSTLALSATPMSASTLRVFVDGVQWHELGSLLESGPGDEVFRVEIDDLGDATVAFGNGALGMSPDETADVTADYRIGGGTIGNVAADKLTTVRALFPTPWCNSVTNPVPAAGGRDLESRDHARRYGPQLFERPLVAVTTADYENVTQEFTNAGGTNPIRRAFATVRWTGSWLTVTIAIDPAASETIDASLRSALITYLDGRRLAGYDLEVLQAVYVPIELDVSICLLPGYRAADVGQALRTALSTGVLPGGKPAFFSRGNFSFGDGIHVSRLFAAIMAVPGVEAAGITRLARASAAFPDVDTANNLVAGVLAAGAAEVVQLDNDPNYPENGVLTITVEGVGV